jgi:hypothetical protein
LMLFFGLVLPALAIISAVAAAAVANAFNQRSSVQSPRDLSLLVLRRITAALTVLVWLIPLGAVGGLLCGGAIVLMLVLLQSDEAGMLALFVPVFAPSVGALLAAIVYQAWLRELNRRAFWKVVIGSLLSAIGMAFFGALANAGAALLLSLVGFFVWCEWAARHFAPHPKTVHRA